MKKKFSKELIIGASVLLALLILFFGIDYLKGINVFKSANYYYASYTNVAGLTQSAPVTLNVFKVGLVREINYEYDNPGHVLVELSLDKQLKIPVGTKAEIVTDMLGTSSVELIMASSNEFCEIGARLEGETKGGMVDNTVCANDLVLAQDLQQKQCFSQPDLFTTAAELEQQEQTARAAEQKESQIQTAILKIRQKYGKNAILRGLNFEPGATMTNRNHQIGGHRA